MIPAPAEKDKENVIIPAFNTTINTKQLFTMKLSNWNEYIAIQTDTTRSLLKDINIKKASPPFNILLQLNVRLVLGTDGGVDTTNHIGYYAWRLYYDMTLIAHKIRKIDPNVTMLCSLQPEMIAMLSFLTF